MKNFNSKKDIINILNQVEFEDWEFVITEKNDGWNLQVKLPDNKGKSGKWYISPYMSKSELVQRSFLCILQALEHDARLNFKYKGEAIFKPHYDVDDLVRLSKTSIDKRI
jgi:hypothetical protein